MVGRRAQASPKLVAPLAAKKPQKAALKRRLFQSKINSPNKIFPKRVGKSNGISNLRPVLPDCVRRWPVALGCHPLAFLLL
jgi:hypothetical protein